MRSVFRKDEVIEHKGRQYLFESAIGLTQIVALDPSSGEKSVLDLSGVQSLEAKDAAKIAALDTVDPNRWSVAKRRFAAIQPLLSRDRSKTAYRQAATKAGVDKATIYRWRSRFLLTGLLSALLPDKPGVTEGTKRLADSVETIISDLIENVWMKNPQCRFAEIYEQLTERCQAAKLDLPHANTLRNRLAEHVERRRKRTLELNPDQILARPGGSLVAEYPLEIVQIDHTRLDVSLVDEEFRLALGRPWLTVAIDVATRIILGFYLSFDAPSANSVGLCLFYAFTRKDEWLRSRGIDVSWPVWGIPTSIHADNGKDFRGEMLRRVCEEYGVNLNWRPVRKPRWGGHIERLIGTIAIEMKRLPGATFSNPEERGDYPSEKKAVFTLRELERYLASWICDTYHQRTHRSLGKSPIAAWKEGTVGPRGIGLPRLVSNERRLRLNLMPFFERTVSESGVVIDNVWYYNDALRPYVGAVIPGRYRIRRKFTFRRDPRDIGLLYLQDPQTGEFVEVPYRNTSHPPVSIWELRAAAESVREDGRDPKDEDALFAAVKKRRQMVVDATKRTKAVRRSNELHRHHAEARPKSSTTDAQLTPPKHEHPSAPPPLYDGIRLS